MKNGKFLSILAFLIATAGLVIGLAALLKRKSRRFADELDFDDSIYLEDDDYDYSEADGEDFGDDEDVVDAVLDETIAEESNGDETL